MLPFSSLPVLSPHLLISGDKVEAKILRKIEESGKTFIELTKRKEHMKLDEGLDKDL